MASQPSSSINTPSPAIHTPRLILRNYSEMIKSIDLATAKAVFHEHYLRFFHSMRTNPGVMQYSFSGYMDAELAETETWLRERINRAFGFVVERKSISSSANSAATDDSNDTEPIGSMSIRLPAENEKGPDAGVTLPEIGFMLDARFHGHGYATEAVGALMHYFWASAAGAEYAFVEAYVDADNTASVHVVEKCGYVFYQKLDGGDESTGKDTLIYRSPQPQFESTD